MAPRRTRTPDVTKSRKILIYDLGGGTADCTVVEYSANNFRVISTDGDAKLGGADWNDRLADYVCQNSKSGMASTCTSR